MRGTTPSYVGISLSVVVVVLALSRIGVEAATSSIYYPEGLPGDNKQYAILTLDNGLEVLLINDNETYYSGAAVNVGVGSFNDPVQALGLAHFLEHLLFLGTEQYPYPGPNSFTTYLYSRGGYSNAYTSFENTNYYFYIQNDYFKETLARFSDFFSTPLITEKFIEKEVNAVNAEYELDKPNYGWKFSQLVKTLSNPEHPYSHFDIGNTETLIESPKKNNSTIRSELFKFFNKYYTTNLMKLVLLSPEPIATLETWANLYFSDIKKATSNNDPSLEWKGFPFPPEYLLRLVKAEAYASSNYIHLFFALPPLVKFFRCQPINYLESLLYFPGNGSLIDHLAKSNLATDIELFIEVDASQFSVIVLSLRLTEEGLASYQQVIGAVVNYLNTIREQGINQWRYNEMAHISDLNLLGVEVVYDVEQLSEDLWRFGKEHVLDHSYYYEDEGNWENLTKECLDEVFSYLKPAYMSVIITSPQFTQTDHVEPWFETGYNISNFTLDEINDFQSLVNFQYSLPQPNIFIPEDLSTQESNSSEYPVKIYDSKFIEAWFKHDNYWNVPKSQLFFAFQTPIFYSSPTNYLSSIVLLRMIEYQLLETQYYAYTAGLDYELELTANGLTLTVYGYQDKQILLVEEVFQILSGQAFEEDQTTFEVEFGIVVEDIIDLFWLDPAELVWLYLDDLTVVPHWSADQLLAIADYLTFDDVVFLLNEFNYKLKTKIFCYGNVIEEDTNSYVKLVRTYFQPHVPVLPNEIPKPRTVQIPLDSSLTYPISNITGLPSDSALLVYYQIGRENYFESALVLLLKNILSPLFFDQLRTEEQLGYYVSVESDHAGILGLYFLVQSDVEDSHHLENRVESFLKQWKKESFPLFTEDKLNLHKDDVAFDLDYGWDSMAEEGGSYWEEILEGKSDFARNLGIMEALPSITKEHIEIFYNYYLLGETKKRLSIQLDGDSTEAQEQVTFPQDIITLPTTFKANSNLYSKEESDDLEAIPALYTSQSPSTSITSTSPEPSLSGLEIGLITTCVALLLIIVVLIIVFATNCCPAIDDHAENREPFLKT